MYKKENMDNEKIKDLLFKLIERPKKLQDVKIYNVFNNKYRINLWTKIEENGLDKNKIHSSYFVKLIDDKIEIINL
jgi:hypothetical protein